MSLQHHIRVKISFGLGCHWILTIFVRLVISKMKVERGVALQDLLTGAYDYVDTLELQPHARIYLLDHLASTEYDLVHLDS